jgi:hypothetical protein
MADIFEHSRQKAQRDNQANYLNMVDDPYLNKRFNNCCGLAATGDSPVEEVTPAPSVKAKVMNMQAWGYAKTALALVGLYVVVKYAISKFKV